MMHHIQHRLRKHGISFKHAFEGILWALKTQPNYQIHVTLSFLALAAGYYFHISYVEFLVIVILIFIGLAIETVNTSIEKLADAIDTNFNEHIKVAKDLGAGAMLFFAFGAFIASCIIFLPKMFS